MKLRHTIDFLSEFSTHNILMKPKKYFINKAHIYFKSFQVLNRIYFIIPSRYFFAIAHFSYFNFESGSPLVILFFYRITQKLKSYSTRDINGSYTHWTVLFKATFSLVHQEILFNDSCSISLTTTLKISIDLFSNDY